MNGELVDDIRIIPGKNTLLFKMLDEVVATTNGVWVNVRGYRLRTIQITGLVNAEVEIREATTDLANRPANSDDGSLVGPTLAANCSEIWISSSTWIKIKVPTYVSGTIVVFLCVERGAN